MPLERVTIVFCHKKMYKFYAITSYYTRTSVSFYGVITFAYVFIAFDVVRA